MQNIVSAESRQGKDGNLKKKGNSTVYLPAIKRTHSEAHVMFVELKLKTGAKLAMFRYSHYYFLALDIV